VAVEVAVVVKFVEADSSCFPFDFDEIEVEFGDGGSSFGYQASYISNRSERRKEYINLLAIDKGYRCTT
jgi:hypothetical protein